MGNKGRIKYQAAHAGRYKSKYGIKDNNSKVGIITAIGAFLLIIIFIIIAFSSCENVKHVEAMEDYTQVKEEFIEEANLVDIDGFYAGTGELNGITHVRFVAEKNGQKTDTIDVTKRFFSIVYTDNISATNVKMEGKVKAYKRTYEKDSDIKTHYYYVLYSSKSKIKEVGKLSSD